MEFAWVLRWLKRRFNTEATENEHRGHGEEGADLKDQRYTEEGEKEEKKNLGEGGYYVGGDGFAAAYGVHAFVGFGFEVDFFGGHAQCFG